MKRILLTAAFALLALSGFAQKKITEGVISYEVEFQLPPQAQQYAAMFPKEMKVYFKGDSSNTKSESQMSTTAYIMNSKTEYERLLLDIPMMSKKYSVVFTPADQEKMVESMPQFDVKAGTETQDIAGFKAQKYSITEKKSGQTFDVWISKDVEVAQNSLNRFYDKSYGFPVQFTSYQNGMSIKVKVKDIKEEKVPAGIFSASKEYEEITLAQLMAMSGGR